MQTNQRLLFHRSSYSQVQQATARTANYGPLHAQPIPPAGFVQTFLNAGNKTVAKTELANAAPSTFFLRNPASPHKYSLPGYAKSTFFYRIDSKKIYGQPLAQLSTCADDGGKKYARQCTQPDGYRTRGAQYQGAYRRRPAKELGKTTERTKPGGTRIGGFRRKKFGLAFL